MILFSAKKQTFRNSSDPVLDFKNVFSMTALDDCFCFHYLFLKGSLPSLKIFCDLI